MTAIADAGGAGSAGNGEAGPFGSERFEGRDVALIHAKAAVGDVRLLLGVGDDLVMAGMGVRTQVGRRPNQISTVRSDSAMTAKSN